MRPEKARAVYALHEAVGQAHSNVRAYGPTYFLFRVCATPWHHIAVWRLYRQAGMATVGNTDDEDHFVQERVF